MELDKTLIKKHFTTGLQTYGSNAIIQQNIAAKLVDMVVDLGFKNFNKILEVGCGSGFLTRNLIDNLKIQEFIVNDITSVSHNHINCISTEINKKIQFLCGDAEIISFPRLNSAIFSTSTIQWFSCLESFFKKVNISLNSEGLFAFSTFGTENFNEIRKLTGVGLEYHSLNTLEKLLSENFIILAKKEWKEVLEFEHPVNVLRHIKKTGVNGIKRDYFGKSQLKEFTKDYFKHFKTTKQTVTLTYHPIIIIAQKRGS